MDVDPQETWAAVDAFATGLLVGSDPALDAAIEESAKAGLPEHQVSASQGKLLQLLVEIQGAERILELGTLGAYSTIWLARALPEGGRMVTLERDERYAEVARGNLERAGLAGQVEVRVGPALESLPAMIAEDAGPFGLTFIDADKANNPDYLLLVLALSRPGSVIVADNVVRAGALADADSDDPKVVGQQRMHELIGADPGLSATTIQTVGEKGYDGFTLIRVL